MRKSLFRRILALVLCIALPLQLIPAAAEAGLSVSVSYTCSVPEPCVGSELTFSVTGVGTVDYCVMIVEPDSLQTFLYGASSTYTITKPGLHIIIAYGTNSTDPAAPGFARCMSEMLMIEAGEGEPAAPGPGPSNEKMLEDASDDAEPVFIEVVEPDNEYFPVGESIHYRFWIRGDVDAVELAVTTQPDWSDAVYYPCTQDELEPRLFTVTLTPLQASTFRGGVWITEGENRYQTDICLNFACYSPYTQDDAGVRYYSKYLDVQWWTIDGIPFYYGWNDPAENMYYAMGELATTFDGDQEGGVVYRIQDKTGGVAMWFCLTESVHRSTMTQKSTEDSREIAIMVCMGYDRDANKHIIDQPFSSDDCYNSYLSMYRVFTEMGCQVRAIKGYKTLDEVQAFLSKELNEVDYNDKVYIYATGHAGEDTLADGTTIPYIIQTAPRTPLWGEHLEVNYNIGEHYINCVYIIDTCFSARFKDHLKMRYLNEHGHAYEMYCTAICSVGADEYDHYGEGGTMFSHKLKEYILGTDQLIYMLDDIRNEIKGLFLNVHCYYDTTRKDSMVVFTR